MDQGGLSALRWRTLMVRMNRFHSTPKLSRICFPSWIPTNLWDLMGIMQESSKSWLVSLQNLSSWFLSSPENLERSQLVGSWQMLSQFSRRPRRRTPETTGLSVSLWCLIKLWRLFWEVLTNTWKTTQLCGHSMKSDRDQEMFRQCFWALGVILEKNAVQGWDLDSILVGPFQLSLFHDCVILWKSNMIETAAPFSLPHSKRTSEAMPGAVASFAVLFFLSWQYWDYGSDRAVLWFSVFFWMQKLWIWLV